jgi:hypothetical protein
MSEPTAKQIAELVARVDKLEATLRYIAKIAQSNDAHPMDRIHHISRTVADLKL